MNKKLYLPAGAIVLLLVIFCLWHLYATGTLPLPNPPFWTIGK